VNRVLGGRAGKFGETWTLNLLVVDVNTGRLLDSLATREKGKMDALLDVAPAAALALLKLGPQRPPRLPPRPANPKELTLDLGGGVKMQFLLIPAGEFIMGSKLSPSEVVGKYGGVEKYYKDEHPRHRVKLTKPFYMGKHEVTVGQFRRFVESTGYATDAEKGGQDFEDGKKGGRAWGAKGWEWNEDVSWRKPGFEQTDAHPVVLVSWNDATAFCKWVSRKEGRTYGLPTEAQWEYACRAGSSTAYWWGDEMDDTGKVANVADSPRWNAAEGYKAMRMDDGFKYTAPAGHYRANAFGLYDMIGNVWEWCSDWKGDYEAGSQVDPVGPSTGSARVLRGGSWGDAAGNCRCAFRCWVRPADRNSYGGFRVSSGTR